VQAPLPASNRHRHFTSLFRIVPRGLHPLGKDYVILRNRIHRRVPSDCLPI
jgi:hypothetical protein